MGQERQEIQVQVYYIRGEVLSTLYTHTRMQAQRDPEERYQEKKEKIVEFQGGRAVSGSHWLEITTGVNRTECFLCGGQGGS